MDRNADRGREVNSDTGGPAASEGKRRVLARSRLNGLPPLRHTKFRRDRSHSPKTLQRHRPDSTEGSRGNQVHSPKTPRGDLIYSPKTPEHRAVIPAITGRNGSPKTSRLGHSKPPPSVTQNPRTRTTASGKDPRLVTARRKARREPEQWSAKQPKHTTIRRSDPSFRVSKR